jgi:drug/metabolite transporter (DMT)-like permease
MTPLKSQILGLLLGLTTAIGCIFYEKIVHNFSFMGFMLIKGIETALLCGIAYFYMNNNVPSDYSKFISEPKYMWWALIYVATGITSVLWYIITEKQGVMAGSIYEVKYIIMLALIYIAFGDNKFTLNTGIGVVMAMISIYFISKS